MNRKLNDLKNVRAENCVSIIMNTHRTLPDYQKDVITLKNLIKEAENRLQKSTDKKEADAIVARLNQLESQIEYSRNLESLILFVNVEKNIAEIFRLPLPVTDRVIIGETFATRDLLRAIHLSAGYYILVLSQKNVRLLQAMNDDLIKEFTDVFPIENKGFFTNPGVESSYSTRQTNLIAEFFNLVDKEVNKVRRENPLPVLICTDEANYYDYLKIADERKSIYDIFLPGNRLDEKASVIVQQAWPLIKSEIEKQNIERKKNLQKAVDTGLFLTDVNEISNAIKQGRVDTLFVQQGLFQPAIIADDHIELLTENDDKREGFIDDIFDELIELNMDYNGNTVFLPKEKLEKFNGFAATLRY